jgi:hypothetical protein
MLISQRHHVCHQSKGVLMTNTTARDTEWGPLSEPLHLDIPRDAPPYKDNVFIAFWDPSINIFGSFHASTSPNATGRRIRFSYGTSGEVIETIEPLDRGTYTSDSLDFDLAGTLTIRSARIEGQLTFRPHRALADFATRSTVPSLVPDQPLQHYQRGTTVTGTLVVDGREVSIDGLGFRDRTWGFRDESVSFREYFGLFAVFPDYSIAAQRHLSADGHDRTEGYVLTDSDAQPVTGLVDWSRDASGLFSATRITIEGGHDLTMKLVQRNGGFWVPMGWERIGPTLSAYDEFGEVQNGDGDRGHALVEQGIVRQLF